MHIFLEGVEPESLSVASWYHIQGFKCHWPLCPAVSKRVSLEIRLLLLLSRHYHIFYCYYCNQLCFSTEPTN